jgi:hypothetical protein
MRTAAELRQLKRPGDIRLTAEIMGITNQYASKIINDNRTGLHEKAMLVLDEVITNRQELVSQKHIQKELQLF